MGAVDTVKRPQCCQVSGCGLCSPLVGCGAWPSSALVGGGGLLSPLVVVVGPHQYWWHVVVVGHH